MQAAGLFFRDLWMRTLIRSLPALESMNIELRASGASYREIAEAGGGIVERFEDPGSIRRRAAQDSQALNWSLRTGTTTIEAKSGYGFLRFRRQAEDFASNSKAG